MLPAPKLSADELLGIRVDKPYLFNNDNGPLHAELYIESVGKITF